MVSRLVGVLALKKSTELKGQWRAMESYFLIKPHKFCLFHIPVKILLVIVTIVTVNVFI